MKKRVVYITHWVAADPNKEYPHGWGFEPPIVEFPLDMDAAEVAKWCRELNQPGFLCIGATARELVDGNFEIRGIEEGPNENSEEWAVRDIDLILDNADFGDDKKIKEIERITQKYFKANPK